MKIIWLEDEPGTISVIKNRVKKYCQDITICESFSYFSDKLELLLEEQKSDYLIIIDIRIVVNVDAISTCFGNNFLVKEELEAGLEYYIKCLKNRFDDKKIIFLSSKNAKYAKHDGEEYGIPLSQIIAKNDIYELIERVKNETNQ
ncbi:MAG: hypothetical protein KAG56_00595 [Sulfurovaceae bacterium]|nr:hypothetical protein [Sulfurovaceae bacterium]